MIMPAMEPAKLTKAQADALKIAVKDRFDDRASVVRLHVNEPTGWLNDLSPLNGLGLNTIIHALYVGIDIEYTKEDRIREYRDRLLKAESFNSDIRRRHVNILIKTLNLADIYVDGVNK